MSATVLTSFTRPAVAQSNIILNDAIKLKEFQSATQGYEKHVKKMAGGDINSIMKVTDSYVVKIKSINIIPKCDDDVNPMKCN